jgi:hypothetical protein
VHRRLRDSLGVIARARGDDPVRKTLARQLRDRVGRAPQLEGPCPLKVLGLQSDRHAENLLERV